MPYKGSLKYILVTIHSPLIVIHRGGLSNMDAGRTYGQYVRKYDAFMRKGKNMHNGMGIYWNIASM